MDIGYALGVTIAQVTALYTLELLLNPRNFMFFWFLHLIFEGSFMTWWRYNEANFLCFFLYL